MSFIRPWALWRRIQYTIGFFLSLSVVGVLIYFINFYVPPNCFDGLLNGQESGIDCGGGCVQICAASLFPPRVVWTDSFQITDNQYNVVAYVENTNQTAGTPELEYTFELFNGDTKIGERTGKTILPPNSVYPIFEGRVFISGDKPVTSTNIILQPAKLWLPSSVGRDQFRSVDINLSGADSRPQLSVEIENTALVPAENVEVVATVFNEKGEAVTASQTFIDKIDARSTEDIVFTWPNPIAKTVKSCVIPTDVVLAIDLSGSMNNDGDNPPQPVTRALEAAGKFVEELNTKDQVGVVTFATKAEEITSLTSSHEQIAEAVRGLSINPKEEAGFTNTVDALKLSSSILNSNSHNGDARRVLVLLTDGLPTAEGDSDVVTEAEQTAQSINENGVEIYAIGLGSGVDQDFIRNIASARTNAYFAPTGEDLNSIYTKITSSLCEAGPTKIDVVAKTETNFAPIR